MIVTNPQNPVPQKVMLKDIDTQRKGTMSIVDLNSKTVSRVTGVPNVHHAGQGGLLDVAVSPNFKNDASIYFSYSVKIQGKSTTRLSRAVLSGNTLPSLAFLYILIRKVV